MINRINLDSNIAPRKSNTYPKHKYSATEIETVIQPRLDHHNLSIRNISYWIKNKGFRTKAIIFAVTVGVLPILGIGIATYSLVNKSVTKQITNYNQTNALWILDNIDSYLKNRKKEITSLAKSDWLSTISEQNNMVIVEKQLKNWHNSHNIYKSITILDTQNNVFISTDNKKLFKPQHHTYLQRVWIHKKTGIINLWVGKETNQSEVYVFSPIFNHKKQKSKYIIQAIISIDSLESIIKHPRIIDYDFYLVDSQGKIFLSNNEANKGDKIQDFFAEWRVREIDSTFTSVLKNKANQREELTTIIPWNRVKSSSSPEWQLILSTDKAFAFNTQSQLLLILAMGTVITAVSVGAAVVFLVNRLTLPIVTATMAVKKLSKGNLTTRIDVKGEDEIADLGASINRMADQLQDLQNNQLEETERLERFTNILIAIRQSLHSDDLLKQAVSESRIALAAHRVVIYHLNSRNTLQVLAESVAPGVNIGSGKSIESIGIIQELVDICQQHGLIAVNNVLEKEFAPEYLQLMQILKIKATLVTPILKDNQIFGFLMADYCWAPHIWQYFEINFLSQLAVQVGLSLERVSLIDHTQALKELAIHMSGSLNSQDIYQVAVDDIQKALQVERVFFYKLHDDSPAQSRAIAECAIPGLASMMYSSLTDDWVLNYLENLQQSDVEVIEIDGLPLEEQKIDGNLVAPVILNEQLFGFLITHDVSQVRVWQQSEIDLLAQLARHIGLALERASVLENSLQALARSENSLQQQTDNNRELHIQLQQLLNAIAEIAHGDLTVRAPLNEGEIGEVAQFLNQIADNLQTIATQIKLSDRQVNTALAENSGAISQLAISALKQSEEISRTLDAVENMQLSIKDVATKAQQALTVTNTGTYSTENDLTAIKVTIDQFLGLGTTIVTAMDEMQHMGESMQEISRLVSSINQIVTETNIVAINAGIEANRLGVQGQEFSLLAEEITGLTSKTASATTEIEQIICNLQQQTQKVSQLLKQDSIQIEESSSLWQNHWLSFSHIADVYHQIDELVQSIAIATTSQVEISKEVTKAMKQIAKVSKMTGNSSRKFSASLQKTAEVSQQLQTTIKKMQVS